MKFWGVINCSVAVPSINLLRSATTSVRNLFFSSTNIFCLKLHCIFSLFLPLCGEHRFITIPQPHRAPRTVGRPIFTDLYSDSPIYLPCLTLTFSPPLFANLSAHTRAHFPISGLNPVPNSLPNISSGLFVGFRSNLSSATVHYISLSVLF